MTYSSTSSGTLDLAAIRARHTLLLLARLWQGNRARVDLARELGLSRSAISSMVTELMDARLGAAIGTILLILVAFVIVPYLVSAFRTEEGHA